jgi:hypothetical protein
MFFRSLLQQRHVVGGMCKPSNFEWTLLVYSGSQVEGHPTVEEYNSARPLQSADHWVGPFIVFNTGIPIEDKSRVSIHRHFLSKPVSFLPAWLNTRLCHVTWTGSKCNLNQSQTNSLQGPIRRLIGISSTFQTFRGAPTFQNSVLVFTCFLSCI